MPTRFFILLILLAALITAATYFYTTETKEVLSDPGLADLERLATVHGWPWGYYAEGIEVVRLDEESVAWFEYKNVYWQMLGQTYLAWFIASMVVSVTVVVLTDPSRKRR